MNKPCLILGVGGSGTNILNIFVKSQKNIKNIIPLAIDTDNYSLSKLDDNILKISLSENEMASDVYQRIEPFIDKTWFSDFEYKENANLLKILKTNNGAHSWRQQGFLSLVDYLLDDEKVEKLNKYIDLFASKIEDNNYEIYLLSSTNGGTGSGIFLTLSLYLKKYIKDKYDLDIKIKMILLCPDVYADFQNVNEKRKSYANGYAALKELNAVNLVTNGFNDLNEDSLQDTINFKIAFKDLVLFDSKDKKFWTQDSFPFEKIYLFERIPTIMSVSTHEQIVSSTIEILLNTKQEDVIKNAENVYAGISISKIQYPAENIVDYLLHRYLYDELNNEWLYIFKKFEHKKKFLEGANKNGNQSKMELMSNLYKTILNNEKKYNDLDINFLNRGTDNNDEYYNIKYDLRDQDEFIEKTKEEFLNFVNEYHNDLDSSKIDNLLNENYAVDKINLFDSKKIKEDKKRKLVERVQFLGLEYKKFIIETINNYLKDGDGPLQKYIESIINKLITNNLNEYIHPVIFLYRIINFYKSIKIYFSKKISISRVNNITEEKMQCLRIEDLPSNIFKLNASVEYASCSYLKAGEDVLIKICEHGDTSKLSDLEVDYKYIIEDFKSIVLDIKTSVSDFYFKNVLLTFENVINKYIEFFERLKYSVDDLEYEVKELKNINTFDTLFIKNVGSSVEEKEALYAEFIESIKNKGDNDSIIGKLIFDFIDSNDIKDINRIKINELRKEYLSIIKEQMKDNEVIQKISNNNIFEAVINNDEEIVEIKNFKKVFSGILNYNFRPLNLNTIQGKKIINPIVKNNILISLDSKEYICKNSDRFKLKSIEESEQVDEFFYKLGNSNNKINCSNLVNNKEFLTVYEISNLKLSWLKNIDEETSDSYYYKEFYDSLHKKVTTNSFLWNPSLYKVDNYDICLPTINLDKQIKIDINNIKSLVYEFMNKKIITSDVSPNITNVYFHQQYLEFEPLKYCDEYINSGEINKVIKMFRNNFVFTTETSEKFDHYINKLCYGLPFINKFNGVNIECILNAIYKSSFIKVIQDEFLKNMTLETTEELIYIDIMIKMLIQIFDKMLKTRLANVKIDDDLLEVEIKSLIFRIFDESYQDNKKYEKIINKNLKNSIIL